MPVAENLDGAHAPATRILDVGEGGGVTRCQRATYQNNEIVGRIVGCVSLWASETK